MHIVQKLLREPNQIYMQLYWLIPDTFYVMTFDLQGQNRPVRQKQRFQNPNNAYSLKANRNNFNPILDAKIL